MYTVEFTDNEIMTETRSLHHRQRPVPVPPEKREIVRCFVPQQEMKTTSIGKPLGEMLVEEHWRASRGGSPLEGSIICAYKRIGDYLAENHSSRGYAAKASGTGNPADPELARPDPVEAPHPDSLRRRSPKQRQNRKQRSADPGRMGVIDERALNGRSRKVGIP